MRKRSDAKSAASSPPVPARISSTTFLASFGILGNEEDLDVGEQHVAPLLELPELLLRQLAHVGILQQLLGRVDLRDDVLVLAESIDQRLHLRHRLRVVAEFRRVGLNGRLRHLDHHLVVLAFDCCSLSNIGLCPWSFVPGLRCSVRGRQSWSPDRPSVLPPSVIPLTPEGGTRPRRRPAARSSVARTIRSPRTTRWWRRRRVGKLAGEGVPGILRGRAVGQLPRQLGGAGDVSQPREEPDGHVHARSMAIARAASSLGSAVAPSIQTSPPSKCSRFQIGAICLTRSMA